MALVTSIDVVAGGAGDHITVDDQEGAALPPAAQAQMAQMQAKLKEAEQLLQMAQQEIQGKQQEQRTKMEIAQMEAEKDIRLQAMRDASAIAVAKINAMTKGLISDNERQVEEIALAQETERTRMQQEHEVRMTDQQRGAEQAHDMETMQLEHQQALEQQQQAADLAPEPTEKTPA